MPPLGQRFEMSDDYVNERHKMFRGNGYFITKLQILLVLFIFIAGLVAVGLITYYVSTPQQMGSDNLDKTIESKIDGSVDSIMSQQTSSIHQRSAGLPHKIVPLHYRLRIDPTFDNGSNSNFTFAGEVIITLFINGTNTRKIELHTSSLTINRNDIQVAMQEKQSKPVLKSMSQIRIKPLFRDDIESLNFPDDASNNTGTNPTEIPTTTMLTSETTSVAIPTSTTLASNLTTETVSVETTVATKETTISKSSTTTEPIISSEMPTTSSSTESLSTTEVEQSSTEDDTGEQIHAVNHLIKVKKYEFQPQFEKLTLHLEESLEKGHNYTVRITFSGHLHENYEGFYHVSYKDGEKVRSYAATLLEPTFARKAFPCLDEPSFKAQFTISIGHSKDMISLSNAPLKESEPRIDKPGYIWDHFETTPPMSTYSVAFIVGDFTKHKTTSDSGIDINVWARSDRVSTSYLYSVAPKIFDYYQSLFSVNYPFSKLDLVGVDLVRSATDSWGLIGLREEYFFADDSSVSESMKQEAFLLLSQQIVHQWIGNLVSINWWSNLWLKESLASYLSILAANQIRPEWNINETFLIKYVQPSLGIDQVKSIQSLASIILETTQISEYLESSIHQKGAALFRMLNYTLTEPVLIDGIKQFLEQRSYKVGTENDLWQALTTSDNNSTESILNGTNCNLKEIVSDWIHKPGVPLVTIEHNNQTGNLNITQQRYPRNKNSESTNWYIPLFYSTQADTEGKVLNSFWLNKKDTSIEIAESSIRNGNNSDWTIFNPSQIGAFRVNYDSKKWKLLTENWHNTSATIKSQLLDDIFSNAFFGLTDYNLALNMSLLLTTNETKSGWLSWSNAIDNINLLMADAATYDLLHEYIINIVKPAYSDSTLKTDLQELVQKIACKYELEECVKWAQMEFSKLQHRTLLNPKDNLSENQKFTVYCTAVSTGGKKEWDFLWNQTQTTDMLEYHTILSSLSCTQSKWILKRYLTYIFIENQIKLSSLAPVLSSFNSRLAKDVLFEFTRDHFSEINNKTKINTIVHIDVLKTIFSGLSTKEQLHELLNFYEKHESELQSYVMIVKEAVENLKTRIEWSETNLPKVENWLRKQLNRCY